MREKYRKRQTDTNASRLQDHVQRKKQLLAEGLELPKDVSCGEVIVTVTGRRSLVLENYRGIFAFDDDCIQIRTKDCKVKVCGERLKVAYYTDEEMKIIGVIRQICYEV